MKLRRTATSVYSMVTSLLQPVAMIVCWQNGHTFSGEKKKPSLIRSPLIRPNFFGPLVTVLTGLHYIAKVAERRGFTVFPAVK